jgi:HEPN domain-containing protein
MGKIDRTTPRGLWRYANEFFESAVLTRKEKGKFFVPSYYLICHSLELALKAFLRAKGKHLPFLKRLGHDLEKLVVQAENYGISNHGGISEKLKVSIKLVNQYYKTKQFEYISVGSKILPDIDILICEVSEIIKNIKIFCIEKRKV